MRRLAVGGVLVLGLATGGTVSAQAPSETPATSPDGAATWTEVETTAFDGLDTIEQAASTGSEIVAVGTRCDDDGACERVALATTDGVSWTERGPLPADVDLLADLVADGTDLYLVGSRPVAHAAVWRSTDHGATWADVDPDDIPGRDVRRRRSPSGGIEDESVLALVRGPAGLLAGGWLNGDTLDRSAIWASADGTDWERIRLPRGMDRAGGVFGLAATDEGYVAATAQGPWRSDDGREWTRAAMDGTADVPPIELVATDAGYVGLGTGDESAAVWTAEPAGTVWRRDPVDPAMAGLWEAELRSDGQTVLAVGAGDGDERIPTLWRLEGGTWTRETIPAAPGADATDVVSVGEDLLVVGTAPGIDGAPSASAWLRTVDPPVGG